MDCIIADRRGIIWHEPATSNKEMVDMDVGYTVEEMPNPDGLGTCWAVLYGETVIRTFPSRAEAESYAVAYAAYLAAQDDPPHDPWQDDSPQGPSIS